MRYENEKPHPPQYYSVELFIDGFELAYQFKIWDMDSQSMNIIIKEDSAILNRIRPGNHFTSKYYSENRAYPMVELNTKISHITRAVEGKFKGYYIVGLSIDNPVELPQNVHDFNLPISSSTSSAPSA